jgi:hypothetical protein
LRLYFSKQSLAVMSPSITISSHRRRDRHN